MKFQIHSVSGASHQTVANGQPCDRWLVTLQVLAMGGKMRNLRRYYYMPTFATKDEAEKAIEKWMIGGFVNLPAKQVFWIKAGKYISVADTDPVLFTNYKSKKGGNK